jgi:hypothetical protein
MVKIWCEECEGTGQIDNSTMYEPDTKDCTGCKGAGYTEEEVVHTRWVLDRLGCMMQMSNNQSDVNDMVESLHYELFHEDLQHSPVEEYKDDYCPKCGFKDYCERTRLDQKEKED